MVLRKIILEELYCKLVILVRDKRVLNESSKYIKCDCCDYSSVKHIMCKVKDSPHYKYVNGDKDEYINYMKLAGIYAGYGLEHGFDIFDNFIKNFDINKKGTIKCISKNGRYIIIDGVHRVSILLNKGYTDIIVNLKESGGN